MERDTGCLEQTCTRGASCCVPGLVGPLAGLAQGQTWPAAGLSPLRMRTLPRDPEFVFYDQLKQVMNAYR